MNYQRMKRTFKRGGVIELIGRGRVESLKAMLEMFPAGKTDLEMPGRGFRPGGLRDCLRGAKGFVPRKPGVDTTKET